MDEKHINILYGRTAVHQVLIEGLMSVLSDFSPVLRTRILTSLDGFAVLTVEQRDRGEIHQDAAEGILQAITEARNAITLKLAQD